MSTQYAFGKIVTNGLVLALDAADRNSYVSGSTTWFDLSGNQNSGSLINGPVYNSAQGGNIVFDGVNDYIEVVPPISSLSNISQFSYSAFVNFNTKTTGNAFFSYGSSLVFTTDILFAWDVSTNVLLFQINNGVEGSATFNYNTFNTWINISVAYNGSLSGNTNRLKVYINGNEVILTFGSYTVPATTATPSNPLCRLGTYASDNSNAWALNGRIANTLLYNRALSAQEVLQNYNAQKYRFGLT